MEYMLYFVLTVIIGLIGAYLAAKIKLPGGVMVGAMITVAAFNIITGKGTFPEIFKTFLQVASGIIIGTRVSKKDLKELKLIVFPTIILLIFMMLMNITLGFLVNKVGGLDIATSLFATSPGGLSDMALLSEDMGANSAYVTLLQLVRLLTIYFCLPAIIQKIYAKELSEKKTVARSTEEREEISDKEQIKRLIMTILVGSAGGALFYYLGVTSGAMIGSMIAVAAFNIFTGKGYCPKVMSRITSVGSGCFLGLKIDMESVLGLTSLLLPTGIIVTGVLAFAFTTAFVINRLTKLDFSVALMASTPGGMQEISLLSEELGTDTPKIAVMQTCRLMFVVSFFPTMIQFLAML